MLLDFTHEDRLEGFAKIRQNTINLFTCGLISRELIYKFYELHLIGSSVAKHMLQPIMIFVTGEVDQ